MDTETAEAIARRAHEFIREVSDVLTDEPEFADTKIPELFAEHGAQLASDAEALRQA